MIISDGITLIFFLMFSLRIFNFKIWLGLALIILTISFQLMTTELFMERILSPTARPERSAGLFFSTCPIFKDLLAKFNIPKYCKILVSSNEIFL